MNVQSTAAQSGFAPSCGSISVAVAGGQVWLKAMRGGSYLSMEQGRNLGHLLLQMTTAVVDGATATPAKPPLTPRETVVLRHLAAGLSNKEVARRLALSVRTVETHRLNLRRKTKTGQLHELVTLARDLALEPL